MGIEPTLSGATYLSVTTTPQSPFAICFNYNKLAGSLQMDLFREPFAAFLVYVSRKGGKK